MHLPRVTALRYSLNPQISFSAHTFFQKGEQRKKQMVKGTEKLSKSEQDALLELKKHLLDKYNLVEIKLFGSKVRGDADKESDIDVLIVLKEVNNTIEDEIFDICFEIDLKYDVVLSAIVYSKAEFNDSLNRVTPFYKSIEKEGVPL